MLRGSIVAAISLSMASAASAQCPLVQPGAISPTLHVSYAVVLGRPARGIDELQRELTSMTAARPGRRGSVIARAIDESQLRADLADALEAAGEGRRAAVAREAAVGVLTRALEGGADDHLEAVLLLRSVEAGRLDEAISPGLALLTRIEPMATWLLAVADALGSHCSIRADERMALYDRALDTLGGARFVGYVAYRRAWIALDRHDARAQLAALEALATWLEAHDDRLAAALHAAIGRELATLLPDLGAADAIALARRLAGAAADGALLAWAAERDAATAAAVRAETCR